MPKISAPTVAEHRATRMAALITAGEEALREGGLATVTPRSVCERAGLSRSSFYDYFSTRDDLLVAIAVEAIERWNRDLAAELTDVEPGLPALKRFVEATMEMAADGHHDLAAVLAEANLAPSSMEPLMQLHETMLHPIEQILSDIAVANPQTVAQLVQGTLNAGVQLVSHGAPHQTVADYTFQFVSRGLAA